MCDRIQNTIGIMILNHWEVMWTAGRNDLFHYTVPNILILQWEGCFFPILLNFNCFPQLLKERPAILQNDYYLPFSRNQQLEKYSAMNCWGSAAAFIYNMSFFLWNISQNLDNNASISLLFAYKLKVSSYVKSTHHPLNILFTAEH